MIVFEVTFEVNSKDIQEKKNNQGKSKCNKYKHYTSLYFYRNRITNKDFG